MPSPPVWIEGTHTLWYLVTTDGGYRFVRVDGYTDEKVAAFDHDRLATSLSGATGGSYTAVTIPYDPGWFRVLGDFEALDFEIEGRAWRCSLSDYRCAHRVGARERDAGSDGDDPVDVLLSPDGRWEALVWDHNVAIRRVGSSDVRALSTEGSEGDGYEIETLSWSPNSRKLAAYRVTPGAPPRARARDRVIPGGSVPAKVTHSG